MNKVILSGNVGKDPDIRDAGGTEVMSFSLATNESYKKENEWVDATEWHNIVRWKPTDYQKNIGKGTKLLVEGRIRTRDYEKDNVKHYVTEIIADKIEVFDMSGKAEVKTAPSRAEQANNGLPF